MFIHFPYEKFFFLRNQMNTYQTKETDLHKITHLQVILQQKKPNYIKMLL